MALDEANDPLGSAVAWAASAKLRGSLKGRLSTDELMAMQCAAKTEE